MGDEADSNLKIGVQVVGAPAAAADLRNVAQAQQSIYVGINDELLGRLRNFAASNSAGASSMEEMGASGARLARAFREVEGGVIGVDMVMSGNLLPGIRLLSMGIRGLFIAMAENPAIAVLAGVVAAVFGLDEAWKSATKSITGQQKEIAENTKQMGKALAEAAKDPAKDLRDQYDAILADQKEIISASETYLSSLEKLAKAQDDLNKAKLKAEESEAVAAAQRRGASPEEIEGIKAPYEKNLQGIDDAARGRDAQGDVMHAQAKAAEAEMARGDVEQRLAGMAALIAHAQDVMAKATENITAARAQEAEREAKVMANAQGGLPGGPSTQQAHATADRRVEAMRAEFAAREADYQKLIEQGNAVIQSLRGGDGKDKPGIAQLTQQLQILAENEQAARNEVQAARLKAQAVPFENQADDDGTPRGAKAAAPKPAAQREELEAQLRQILQAILGGLAGAQPTRQDFTHDAAGNLTGVETAGQFGARQNQYARLATAVSGAAAKLEQGKGATPEEIENLIGLLNRLAAAMDSGTTVTTTTGALRALERRIAQLEQNHENTAGQIQDLANY